MSCEDRLFGDVVNPSSRIGSRRWYTVPLSVLVHTLAVAALLIVPLIATDVLPSPRSMTTFVVAPPPPPPPPPAPRPMAERPVEVVRTDTVPVEAPAEIAPDPTPLDTSFDRGVDGGVPGGIPDGVDGVVGGVPEERFAPAPPPSPPPAPQEPVRVGGIVTPPSKTRDVLPRYPPIAQAAGVSGVVIVEATIGADGRVQDARVLRSIPLLDEAALEAVRQWEFTPTLLNGVPVPIIMTVTVAFSLRR
jgi:periplasmic protein TonB